MNKNKKLLSLSIISIALFSSQAFSAERLVVSSHQAAINTQQQIQSQHCLSTPTGEDWCISVFEKTKALSTQSSNGHRLITKTISIPEGISVEEAMHFAKSTGLFTHVEADLRIKGFSVQSNDPLFLEQEYLKPNNATNPASSSITPALDLIKNIENPVNVFVLDGGFFESDDLVYLPGYNFTVVAYDSERRPGFLEPEFNSECIKPHGLGVAGTIGAKINNNIHIAGLVPNVNITPIRVMDCDIGFLSDVSAALTWLANTSTHPNIPAYNGEPGIINMSLGGASNTCPYYLQQAIDDVVSAGFTVVASAGNESMDVAGSSPANCNNVISVGASSAGSSNSPPDLSWFSNFGKTLDTIAIGEGVPSLAMDNSYTYWAGTSFSGPIVAGIIALVSKDFDFNHSEWEQIISISGHNNWMPNGDCVTLGCGSGTLDAVKLYNNAELASKGELNTSEYSLNLVSSCRQEWAVEHLQGVENICNQITVNVRSIPNLESDQTLLAYSFPKNQIRTGDNTTSYGEFSSNVFTINDANVTSNNLYVEKCTAIDDVSSSCEAAIEINTVLLLNKPAVCN